jgi:CheY-like chemotaxis protein
MTLSSSIDTWRVLVVDDEPDNLYLANQILTFSGAKVESALGGSAGLEAAASFDPNLILLDLAMPEMDGWKVQHELRSQPRFDGVPIIALTALAMPQDADRVREAGFDGYITKPFMIRAFLDEIKKSVNAFLSSRSASSEAVKDA